MPHAAQPRTFDDMLIEDLEPSEEEQLAVLSGAVRQQSERPFEPEGETAARF